MKMRKLNCPNCNGILDMKIYKNTSSIFCPYCGQSFIIYNENEYTINQNIHTRYTDDAEVIKANNKYKENKRNDIICLIIIALSIGAIIAGILIPGSRGQRELNEGKISGGYYQDLIGEDYRTVKAHFEAAGFTNIELIDLDDAGLAVWKNEKVEMISIGGNTSFNSNDYFDSDTVIVISYH